MVRPLTELPVAAVPIHVGWTGIRFAGDCGFHLGLCWGTARGSFVPGNQQAMIYIRCSELDPAFKSHPHKNPEDWSGVRYIEYPPDLGPEFGGRISSGPNIVRKQATRSTCGLVVVFTGAARIDPDQLWSWRPAPSPALVGGERRSLPPVGLQTDLRTQFRHPDFSFC